MNTTLQKDNIKYVEELDKISTCSILEQVASDGKKRKMNLYNLDMIISIGYFKRNRVDTEILIYETEDGETKIQTRLENETVWLSQVQMAELFGKGRSTITEHINNLFKEGELDEELVCRNFRHTTQHGAIEGKTQENNVKYYNLDIIISVGYRVKSIQGTRFRQWATARLREYIVKGFTINDDLLKEAGGGNYFDELLARIRDIRSSEKVFWRKVYLCYKCRL